MKRGWERLDRLASSERASLAALLAAATVVFLAKIWQGPLGGDESCYALLSREILRTKDWVVLHHPAVVEWRDFYEHPPLYMWTTAILYQVLGVGDTAAKLFSALSGWASVAVLYATARRIGGARLALLAGTLLVTALYYVDYARKARLEVPLAFFVLLAFALAVRGVQERSWWSFFGAGIAVALGALTKGVPAAAAAVIVGAWIAASASLGWRDKWRAGLVVAAGGASLVLPWVWMQYAWDGGRFFDWYAHRQVSWSVHGRPDDHGVLPQAGSVGFYFKKLFTEVMVPGALLAAGGGVRLLRRRRWREDLALWIAVLAVAVIVGAFSMIPFHKARYLLPAVPFLALLGAFALEPLTRGRRARRTVVGLLILISGAGLALTLVPQVHFYTKKDGDFLPMVERVDRALAPGDSLLVGGLRPYTAQQVFTWYFDRPLRIALTPEAFDRAWQSGRYRAAVTRDHRNAPANLRHGRYQLFLWSPSPPDSLRNSTPAEGSSP